VVAENNEVSVNNFCKAPQEMRVQLENSNLKSSLGILHGNGE
jgi:hypothetical protein